MMNTDIRNKIVPIIFSLVISLASSLFAEVEKTPADSAFSRIYVSIEGGEIYPFGDISDAVENAFYGGLGLRYSYWPDVDGIVDFDYAYFKVRASGVKFPGVHQFMGHLGLDWHWKWINPVSVGFGFVCDWTRADYDGEEGDYNKRGNTLLDNETEFGYFIRLVLPFTTYDKFKIGLKVLWEETWTLPERSDMLSVGFYVERRVF